MSSKGDLGMFFPSSGHFGHMYVLYWIYPLVKMAKNGAKSMFGKILAEDSYEEFLHMSKNTI